MAGEGIPMENKIQSIQSRAMGKTGRRTGRRKGRKRMGGKSTHRTVLQAATLTTPQREMRGLVSAGMEHPWRMDLQILTTGDRPKEALSPLQ